MEPTFPHDCDECVFQGTVTDGDDIADVYTCTAKNQDQVPVIVIRFGEEKDEWENHGPDCFMDEARELDHFAQPGLFEQAIELVIMNVHSLARDH